MDTRPSWDAWGLALAEVVASRADCTRRQVGAVIIQRDHTVVATGYNGAAPGRPGCLTAGACPRGHSDVAPRSSYDSGPGACIAIHAEQNALMRAGWYDMLGSTLYINHDPCPGCSRMISGSPLARIVTPSGIRLRKDLS